MKILYNTYMGKGGAFEGKPTPGSVKIFGFQEVLRPELVLSSPLSKTNIISTHVQNPVYAPLRINSTKVSLPS